MQNILLVDQSNNFPFRKRKSQILGFKNFAELSTSRKMSKSPSAVWEMIQELSMKAKPVALKELEDLQVGHSLE